jgi:hypothetical protein
LNSQYGWEASTSGASRLLGTGKAIREFFFLKDIYCL